MKKYTTLNEIKKHKPCNSGWKKLLEYTGKTKADNRPLSFRRILLSNGIEDAVWALRVLDYQDRCVFSYDVAKSVLHIFEETADTCNAIIAADAARAAARAATKGSAYSTASFTVYAAAASGYGIRGAKARKNKWKEIEIMYRKHFIK